MRLFLLFLFKTGFYMTVTLAFDQLITGKVENVTYEKVKKLAISTYSN